MYKLLWTNEIHVYDITKVDKDWKDLLQNKRKAWLSIKAKRPLEILLNRFIYMFYVSYCCVGHYIIDSEMKSIKTC